MNNFSFAAQNDTLLRGAWGRLINIEICTIFFNLFVQHRNVYYPALESSSVLLRFHNLPLCRKTSSPCFSNTSHFIL